MRLHGGPDFSDLIFMRCDSDPDLLSKDQCSEFSACWSAFCKMFPEYGETYLKNNGAQHFHSLGS